MERQRTLISDLDFQLIDLLAQRMKISEQIGILKQENNLLVFQPERWKFIQLYALEKAKETGMSADFIEKIFKAIHEESVEIQNNIMKSI
jgi:chorismate mutase